MTDQQQQQQPSQEQQGVQPEDLDLVDDHLEDEGKTLDELWEELARAEAGEAATTDADDIDSPPDDGREDEEAGTGGAADPHAAASDDADGSQASGEPAGKTAPQANDPFAGASEEQRAAWQAAQDELNKLRQYRKSNEGRIAAMQRQIAELSRQRPASAPAQGDQGQDRGAGDGYLASNEWKSFAEEYPEVAGPVGKLIEALESKIAHQDRELAAIGSDRRQAALDEQAELLAKEHADWETITAENDEDFGVWLSTQPRHIREAAYRNAEAIVDAEEAADVISRFKAHLSTLGKYAGPPSQQPAGQKQQTTSAASGQGQSTNKPLSARRQRQLESAAGARSGGPGVASGIPEDADPERLWKMWDDHDRRQQRAAQG